MTRVGSMVVPSRYLNGAAEAGLGNQNGVYSHIKGLSGVQTGTGQTGTGPPPRDGAGSLGGGGGGGGGRAGGGGGGGGKGGGSWDNQAHRDTVERDILVNNLGTYIVYSI